MSLTIAGWIFADVRVQVIALNKILGAYELAIPLMVNLMPTEQPLTIRLTSLDVKVSGKSGRQQRLGTAWERAPQTLRTYDHNSSCTPGFSIPLSASQITALEELRNGSDLKFEFHLSGEAFSSNDRHSVQETMTYDAAQSGWLAELKKASYLNVLLLEVPMPPAEAPENVSTAAALLSNAQRHFANGEYKSCVADCRTIIQELGSQIYDDENWSSGVLKKLGNGSRDMTKVDREKATFSAARHYAHLAHHGESEGGGVFYTRGEAQMVLRLAAAFASRVLEY